MKGLNKTRIASICLILALLLIACGGSDSSENAAPPIEEAVVEETSKEEAAEEGSTTEESADADLKIAVLPVLNTMPLFVAQQEGFYEELGVKVELVPVQSARDRQIALQSGEVDGANTDLIGVVLLVNAGSETKVVRHDSFTSDYHYFSVIAGKESGIASSEDLIAALQANEAQIAISNNTIIEYLTTTMLRQAGYEVNPDDYLEIAAIPVRLEQLAQGSVPAATLPEPLTTLATTIQGGTTILSDSDIDFVPTVLAFNQSVLNDKPEAVKAFLQAYEKAVEAINSDPDAYRDAPIQVPDPVRPTYAVPQFLTARVPSEAEAQAVMDWMVERELIDEAIGYEAVVDGSFLP